MGGLTIQNVLKGGFKSPFALPPSSFLLHVRGFEFWAQSHRELFRQSVYRDQSFCRRGGAQREHTRLIHPLVDALIVQRVFFPDPSNKH